MKRKLFVVPMLIFALAFTGEYKGEFKMEKRLNSSSYILFITNRVLSLIAIYFFCILVDKWHEEQVKMLSLGPIQYVAADLFVGIFLGILLGWFLCDSISIRKSKYMNTVVVIALVILATYKMTLLALGSLGILSVNMTVFKIVKYFQVTLGIFIFLMLYKKIKAKFLKQEAPKDEEKQETAVSMVADNAGDLTEKSNPAGAG
ncbi:MAG: hypothetical protein PHH48_08590 [Eubacteriales bacterium]|nr:hypothetical protein [Eubacteriales bacterium]